MKIKFVDLPRQNKTLKKKILPLLETIIDNADFTMGKRLENFERKFAKYCGKRYAVGVNSGTDALLLCLMAYNVGNGDEVITVPNSYFATAMEVTNVGAKPVFVDIDPHTYCIDVTQIDRAISKKTKAIIPVHLRGQPVDMSPLLYIAKKHNLIVIEDAAQAHGARYKGSRIPVGETGTFSFFPGKNLGGFGDGGVVVTSNSAIAEKIRFLRNDGSNEKYTHEMIGVKSRLDTIQAEILAFKLRFLNKWNRQRREHAQLYSQLLRGVPGIEVASEVPNTLPVYHLYVIEYKKRDRLQQFLHQKGIETNIHYPVPIHLQKPYRLQGYKEGDYPITEQKSRMMLSLPMFPELTKREIVYICNAIKDYVKAETKRMVSSV